LKSKKFLKLKELKIIQLYIYIYIYIFGFRFSLIIISDSDFGITPVHDIIIGISYFYYYLYYYYYYFSRHRPIDPLRLPPNLTLPLCLVFPHGVTVCALRYVFHHPLDMFTFVTFITLNLHKFEYIFYSCPLNSFLQAVRDFVCLFKDSLQSNNN